MATSLLTGRFESADTTAEAIAMPADGPSFGIAPAGTWMWMSRSKSCSSMPSHAGVGPRERPGRPRRFLHDVAELAGQDELALAPHQGRFDEHDVAAGRRVVHAGRDADLVFARHLLGMHARPAEERRGRRSRVDGLRLDLARGDAARDLAGELSELALELPHAGLARVVR